MQMVAVALDFAATLPKGSEHLLLAGQERSMHTVDGRNYASVLSYSLLILESAGTQIYEHVYDHFDPHRVDNKSIWGSFSWRIRW